MGPTPVRHGAGKESYKANFKRQGVVCSLRRRRVEDHGSQTGRVAARKSWFCGQGNERKNGETKGSHPHISVAIMSLRKFWRW
jgi:hypothetical protein